MDFEPKNFLQEFANDPKQEALTALRKTDLYNLGSYLRLSVKQHMRKSKILQVVIEHFVDDNMLSEEILNEFGTTSGADSSITIEIKRMELEVEENRQKQELELRLKALELEERKLEIQNWKLRSKKYEIPTWRLVRRLKIRCQKTHNWSLDSLRKMSNSIFNALRGQLRHRTGQKLNGPFCFKLY